MVNKHEKPTIWNKLYSNTNKTAIMESLNYGFKNPKIFEGYYCWFHLLRKSKLKIRRSLEVGSGTGSYSLILKKLGIVDEVYLLDYSKESLKIAEDNFKKYGIRGKFILGNALDLPFKDNYFDIAISGGLLEHFSEKDALKILSEKARVSRYTLTQVPINTLAYWLMRSIVTLIKGGWPFGYEKPMNVTKLQKMHKRLNLKIIGEEYHDLISLFKFLIGRKTGYNFNFKKNFLNRIFANEIAIIANKTH